MFDWIKKLFGKSEPDPKFRYDPLAIDEDVCGPYRGPPITGLNPDGTLPVSDTDEDQIEFKTYAEAISWVMTWNRYAVFEWDDEKKIYIRGVN